MLREDWPSLRPCLSASESSDLKIWSSENGRVSDVQKKPVWVAHLSDFQMRAACMRFQIRDVSFQIGLKQRFWKPKNLKKFLQIRNWNHSYFSSEKPTGKSLHYIPRLNPCMKPIRIRAKKCCCGLCLAVHTIILSLPTLTLEAKS